METAPIIKLPISVHTPHKELRFCLEDLPGEELLLMLEGQQVVNVNGVFGACITSAVENV
jgi:hypothetical protein